MASDFDRRRFIKAASAAGLVGLAGCSGGPSGDGGDGGDGDVPARIGIVYSDGGLGDNSFNDAAQQGILQAEEEFGIAYDESEPDGAGEFEQFQQQYAGSTDPAYDLVSTIGFNQGDALTETAPDYPDQDFMIVD
ncbi:BMP family ABC transporter substrate-binding protein, partial [Halorubrum sp. E3]